MILTRTKQFAKEGITILSNICGVPTYDPQFLIGTDYAHPIGGPDKTVGFVKAIELPDAQCEKIMWKNAAGLFKLDL